MMSRTYQEESALTVAVSYMTFLLPKLVSCELCRILTGSAQCSFLITYQKRSALSQLRYMIKRVYGSLQPLCCFEGFCAYLSSNDTLIHVHMVILCLDY